MEKLEKFKDVDRIGRYINNIEGTDCFELQLAISQIGEKINEIIELLTKE